MITYEVIDVATGNPLIIRKADFDTDVSPATLTLLSADKAITEGPIEILIRANQGNLAQADSDTIDL